LAKPLYTTGVIQRLVRKKLSTIKSFRKEKSRSKSVLSAINSTGRIRKMVMEIRWTAHIKMESWSMNLRKQTVREAENIKCNLNNQ